MALQEIGRIAGTTCHDSPNRSFGHPHCCALGIAAIGQSFPIVVDLLLRLAHDLQRNGFMNVNAGPFSAVKH